MVWLRPMTETEGQRVYQFRRATTALLVGLLLCAAAPAVVLAALPLNQNLLVNPGFDEGAAGDTSPGWSFGGDVHVKTFGTKAFPQQAYANRYNGGTQYLDCGRGAGYVRQTIELPGRAELGKQIKVRFRADIGGTIGHRARAVLRVIGGSSDVSSEATKALTVTNHYQNVVHTALVPLGSERIEITLELLPKAGATDCKIMADSLTLWLFRP
jgi:hypothetical protein